MGSKAILMPGFRDDVEIHDSRKPERYMRRGLIDCDCDSVLVVRVVWGFESKAEISRSIACVTSGSAGVPSGVENLMPLYSGDCVKR